MTETEAAVLTKTRNFIVEALRERSQGKVQKYRVVLQQLDTTDVNALMLWYHALQSCASALGAEFHDLVNVSLKLDIARAPNEVIEPFLQFLSNLLSSNSCYAKPCFQSFVRFLVPVFDPPRIQGAAPTINVELTYLAADRAHALLHMICTTVPSSPLVLWPCVTDQFPHKSHSLDVLSTYVRNLLRILQYCPLLYERIMALIVERLLQIDVEISLDAVEDEEDDDEEDEHLLQFQFEEKGVTGKQGSSSSTSASASASSSEARGIAEMADKLDGLMMVLFEYITAECRRDEASCDRTFRLFLRIFDSFVLSTYRCKFVQFLVYYLAQFKADLPDLFLGYLLNKLLDQTQPTLTRKVCASYVASFVSRAPFIRLETIRNTLAVLVGWLHKYLDVHEQKSPNPVLHALFYHVCQSVYYIVCFRYSELLCDEEGLEFFRQLGFERVNEARLSPLRFCQSSVAQEFARVTHKLSLLRCKHLLSESLDTIRTSGKRHTDQLDSFFPFDPYLLRESSSFIDPVYITWEDRVTPLRERSNTGDRLCVPQGRDIAGSQDSFGSSYGSASYGTSPAVKYLSNLARSLSHSLEDGMGPASFDSEDLMGTTPEVSYDLNFEFKL
eukprot:CAMPEP_0177688560 /NCGR_PEP_ID=MMETSP0447-20121125/34719_1 /TAXON_ID=0 /ORGANISM="Stygamoeba regulata, Strain BSH-02190019" /LENGTH=613 /DNA_ID=CAMNT_0019198861 /DNA_START=208 /DNA_END=2049 /DNA_ORIENTATION=-